MSIDVGRITETNDLVLCLDALDNRSFRGEPVQNLFSQVDFSNWSTYGGGSSVSNTELEFRGYPVQSLIDDNGSYKGRSIGGFPTFLSGIDYTLSLWFVTDPTATARGHFRYRDGGFESLRIYNDGSGVDVARSDASAEAVSAAISERYILDNRIYNRGYIKFRPTTDKGASVEYLTAHDATPGNPAGGPATGVALALMPMLHTGTYPYRFTEGKRGYTVAEGGGWRNMVGNGKDGRAKGNITYDNGIIIANPQCIEIDDSSDLAFQPTDPFSLECWFSSSTSSTYSLMGNIDDNLSTYPGYDIWVDGNTLSIHIINDWATKNAIKVQVTTDWASNLNQVRHLSVTYDGSCPTTSQATLDSVNIYINGKLYENSKVIGSSADGFNSSSEAISYNPSQNFIIGGRWKSDGANNRGWNGNIKRVQVYSKELSAKEVRRNFNSFKRRFGVEG